MVSIAVAYIEAFLYSLVVEEALRVKYRKALCFSMLRSLSNGTSADFIISDLGLGLRWYTKTDRIIHILGLDVRVQNFKVQATYYDIAHEFKTIINNTKR